MPKKDDLVLEFQPGTVVDNRYEIISLLGFGAIGRVYLAKHAVMNKTFALKFVHPQKISETNLKRFKLEAQASSLLEHPNIIGIHDYGLTPDGVPYIAMEYFQGRSLADELKTAHGISRVRFFDIFQQVCAGLSHAHKNGVLHRDLKPANILIKTLPDGSDVAKVLDFGMAKLMPGDNHEESRITVTGEVVGSPFYMSPEQCMAKDLDCRTDIYSLGVVMHEVLTGSPVFLGKNPIEVMQKHVHNAPVFDEKTAVVPALQQLVLKCLSKDPKKRYQTADELSEALAKLKTHELRASAEIAALLDPTANQNKGETAPAPEHAKMRNMMDESKHGLSPKVKVAVGVVAILVLAILSFVFISMQGHSGVR